MTKRIGVLTSGGDTPGLNAALRGLGKSLQGIYNLELIGFKDGFRGLMENRYIQLKREDLSGILTVGGTILGTSREKPHKMLIDGVQKDMTEVIIDNYNKHQLDILVCIGGGGTQKNAYRLAKKGLNVMTLPKTIDNDVFNTDITFGFDTSLQIATEAIDRLHSTALSHHRIIVVEIMGNKAGWLALGAGLAGGADVVLIPEIPYDVNIVADSIIKRSKMGKPFSIVAVAEGAISKETHKSFASLKEQKKQAKREGDHEAKQKIKAEKAELKKLQKSHTYRLSTKLEYLTGLESRVTILGHLQRGGTPSAADRLLASMFGTSAAEYIHKGSVNTLMAKKGEKIQPVPLAEVAGYKKLVPKEHEWIKSARDVGTCMGDD